MLLKDGEFIENTDTIPKSSIANKGWRIDIEYRHTIAKSSIATKGWRIDIEYRHTIAIE